MMGHFAWPFALLTLLVVPAMVGLYLWLLRRRRRYAVRYASLTVVRRAVSTLIAEIHGRPFVTDSAHADAVAIHVVAEHRTGRVVGQQTRWSVDRIADEAVRVDAHALDQLPVARVAPHG